MICFRLNILSTVWGCNRRPMYGETKLLMKKIERILRMISSSSGSNRSNTNNMKGNRVVFKKKPAQFLYNFIEFSPVMVYLPSQRVNLSIAKLSSSFTNSISTANTMDISTSPTCPWSYSPLLRKTIITNEINRSNTATRLLISTRKYLLRAVIYRFYHSI